MSGMSKNPNTLGIILFLLLISRGSGKLPALGQSLKFDHFIRDMHRMVDMMDRIDGLGQIAFRPSQPSGPKSLFASASPPAFPAPSGASSGRSPSDRYEDHDSSAEYDQQPKQGLPFNLNDLNLSNLNLANVNPANLNLPDLDQLMKMAGPLLFMFGGSHR